MRISKYIDHTMLAPDATLDKIEKLCAEAKEYDFASVCVNTCWVEKCAELLKGTSVNVCTVIGFPLGAMSTECKASEANWAVRHGATEVDMVLNVGFVKSGKIKDAEEDIRRVKEACEGKLLKVILETCLLTDEEKELACRIAVAAGADYVKTSTGFSKGGATVPDVALMRKCVGNKLGVKASGGIRDYDTAMKMISAGASRLGCSAGVAIVNGAASDASY